MHASPNDRRILTLFALAAPALRVCGAEVDGPRVAQAGTLPVCAGCLETHRHAAVADAASWATHLSGTR
jgi:hypothetical protein